MRIIDAQLAHKTIGLSFRKGRIGPEQELLDWFLEQDIVSVPKGHNVTVFREPRLLSGFPDLVIVIWKESVTCRWKSSRANLTPSDLRLMHFLTNEGPKTLEELSPIFSSSVSNGLDRLSEASMVQINRGCWQASSLTTTFAARQIIAVEAKISEWKVALDQAHLNTWFASESYVLVPRVPRDSTLLRNAQKLGVRVLEKENHNWRMSAQRFSGPRSYASWLFNEWAWRASHSFAS